MKNYIWKYKTPEGFDDLVMCGDGEALTGLWFEGSRDDWRNTRECERRETPDIPLRVDESRFVRGLSAAGVVEMINQ